MTTLTTALSALACIPSGSAAPARPVPSPGPDPIALTDAELDQVTGGGGPGGGVINDREGSPVLFVGRKNIGSGGEA